MAVLVFFLGFILLLFLWGQIASWWENRAFRKKLRSLQARFDELDDSTLAESEQALQKLDNLVAAMNEHAPYQQHISERRAVYRPATSFKRKYKRR